MNTMKGYFSLVQYCPDISRLEVANVGVILLVPERGFIRARMSDSIERIRRFFGTEAGGPKSLRLIIESLADRIEVEKADFKSDADLRRFGEQQANKLVVTPPRYVRVNDPENDLKALFEELVGATVKPRSDGEAAPVTRLLARAIRRGDLDDYVSRNVPVRVPALHEELRIPFAFQNGVCNLIQPARFNQATPSGVRSAACQLAVAGSSLHNTTDEKLGKMQLLVVAAFRKKAADEERMVQDILGETGVHLFHWQRLGELTEKIRATGKPVSPS